MYKYFHEIALFYFDEKSLTLVCLFYFLDYIHTEEPVEPLSWHNPDIG